MALARKARLKKREREREREGERERERVVGVEKELQSIVIMWLIVLVCTVHIHKEELVDCLVERRERVLTLAVEAKGASGSMCSKKWAAGRGKKKRDAHFHNCFPFLPLLPLPPTHSSLVFFLHTFAPPLHTLALVVASSLHLLLAHSPLSRSLLTPTSLLGRSHSSTHTHTSQTCSLSLPSNTYIYIPFPSSSFPSSSHPNSASNQPFLFRYRSSSPSPPTLGPAHRLAPCPPCLISLPSLSSSRSIHTTQSSSFFLAPPFPLNSHAHTHTP